MKKLFLFGTVCHDFKHDDAVECGVKNNFQPERQEGTCALGYQKMLEQERPSGQQKCGDDNGQSLLPEFPDVETGSFLKVPVHDQAAGQEHRNAGRKCSTDDPDPFCEKNGRQDVQDSAQKIDLCTETVLPLDLQKAKSEILRQIDGKWKHDDDCNPIGFFVAFSDPQQQKFTPENDEAG